MSAESHHNADFDGEDADGFAAKLTVGSGNVFRHDVSHHDIDDGWDLYTKTDTGAIGPVTIEYSLSYANGTLSDGTQNASGDRNGLKLGGEDIAVNHVIRHTIARGNGKHGYPCNRNPGTMTIPDDVGLDNSERNFSFDGGSAVFRDNTSCRSRSGTNDRIIGDSDSSNQFWSGFNGSRCSACSGALGWSFAGDGSLVVTFGGNRPLGHGPGAGRRHGPAPGDAAQAAGAGGTAKEIQLSGGSSGRPGTGLRSSVQAAPASSVATRRQNRAAIALRSWKAISQGPGCRAVISRTACSPSPVRRAPRTTKKLFSTRTGPVRPRTKASPAGCSPRVSR